MSVRKTVADLLNERAARSFVGRRDELETLVGAAAADEPPFLVAFVHGPGGIGKSRLLQAALSELAAAGHPVARLDCREIEPTPRGFLRALGAALGLEDPDPAVATIARSLAAAPARTVIGIDTYETFGLLDTWLRQDFLPNLPDRLLLLIAGREPPGPGWVADPGWQHLVWRLELQGLDEAESLALLRSRGFAEEEAARINAFARGHPLALTLAGAAGPASGLQLRDGPPPELVAQLTESFLAWLTPGTIETVEAASVVRRVNEPILRALLASDSVRDRFDEIAALPFATATTEGLVLHDVVRDAVSRGLAQRDPEGFARYRRRAAAHFAAEADRPQRETLWRTTADLLYLINNPIVRDGFFPPSASPVSVEPARASDENPILTIARTTEPAPEAADLVRAWWERHPETFRVVREPGGGVLAFYSIAQLADVDPTLLDADPAGRAWLEHLRSHPLRRGERALVIRRWLAAHSGEAPSPGIAACWLDAKRIYMELRPTLRRLYAVVHDLSPIADMFLPLGFAPLEPAVQIGEVGYRGAVLDFGPRSVNGWLTGLIGAEIERESGGRHASAAATTASETPDDGITPREREVLALVAAGASNRAIGERLYVSEKTAARHVANLFGKLGVHSRAEAARIAAERGLTGARSGTPD